MAVYFVLINFGENTDKINLFYLTNISNMRPGCWKITRWNYACQPESSLRSKNGVY